WSSEEKEIFLKKYMEYPKNFRKIAYFLPNKTIYQVTRLYYDNKCTKEFKQIIDQTKSKSQKKTTEYMKQRKTRNSFVGRNKDPIPSNNSSRIWSSDEKQLFMQSLQEV